MRPAVVSALLMSTGVISAEIIKQGVGSYLNSVPPGLYGASSIINCQQPAQFVPAVLKTTTSFPYPTNKWWSSLLWRRCLDNPDTLGSTPVYPYPYAFKANIDGFTVSYAQKSQMFKSQAYSFLLSYKFTFDPFDFRVLLDGLASGSVVTKYSDLHVELSWDNRLYATIARGSPFVFGRKNNPNERLKLVFQGRIRVWLQESDALGISLETFRGPSVIHHYALYFPSGSSWSYTASSDANGAPQAILSSVLLPNDQRFTICPLTAPDNNQLSFLRKYAFARIVDSTVTWNYQAMKGRVETTYIYNTEGGAVPFLVLLPHHQDTLSSSSRKNLVNDIKFISSRGYLKGYVGSTFRVYYRYDGVLPILPVSRNFEQKENIMRDLRFIADLGASVYLQTSDSYWTGKALGKVADMTLVADKLGMRVERNKFLDALRSQLENWFRADSQGPPLFYYDSNVGSLIGHRPSYGSDTDLNDHHFHYGYFIKAAAVVSMYDITWSKKWRRMINSLVNDVASIEPRDTRFPRLRYFDHFVSHSYASGHAAFWSGNNQESSSEAMNSHAAILLWASITNQVRMRNLAIYLYAAESTSIGYYWFNTKKSVFPSDYPTPYASLVWDDGSAHEIFWGPPNPEELQGINLLPVTAASLYLQRYGFAPYYNFLISNKNGRQEELWKDIIWMWKSLFQPYTAQANLIGAGNYNSEPGTTRPFTNYFINANKYTGQINYSIKCDMPHCIAFKKGVYAAYNPTEKDIRVTFSDGLVLQVRARSFAQSKR